MAAGKPIRQIRARRTGLAVSTKKKVGISADRRCRSLAGQSIPCRSGEDDGPTPSGITIPSTAPGDFPQGDMSDGWNPTSTRRIRQPDKSKSSTHPRMGMRRTVARAVVWTRASVPSCSEWVSCGMRTSNHHGCQTSASHIPLPCLSWVGRPSCQRQVACSIPTGGPEYLVGKG